MELAWKRLMYLQPGAAVVKSTQVTLFSMYKGTQNLICSYYIYLHKTKFIYLNLKGMDTPFLCDFIHYTMYI